MLCVCVCVCEDVQVCCVYVCVGVRLYMLEHDTESISH